MLPVNTTLPDACQIIVERAATAPVGLFNLSLGCAPIRCAVPVADLENDVNRMQWHTLLGLPTDRPLLRTSQALSPDASDEMGDTILVPRDTMEAVDSISSARPSTHLLCVHNGLDCGSVTKWVHCVQGDYLSRVTGSLQSQGMRSIRHYAWS